MSDFYVGCRLFKPLADVFDVGVDQVNFLLSMVAGCCLGPLFQIYLDPQLTQAVHRHLISIICGLILALFCFGHQVIHLFIPCVLTYVALTNFPLRKIRYLIFVFNMAYLAVCHILRMYFDYGGYTLDITGPLMILVQRLSMLAFNLYDGQLLNQGKVLPIDRHKLHAIRQFPTLLEFFSYNLNFHTIMIGPFIFYRDYIRFMEGKEDEVLESADDKAYFREHRQSILRAQTEIRNHLVAAVIFGIMCIWVAPRFSPEFYLTDAFASYSYPTKIAYLLTTSTSMRQQYYFAWTLASLNCLCSGLGFTHLNPDRSPNYNMIRSFDLGMIELAPNLKSIVDGWNQPTTRWLREAVYERIDRRYAAPAVFLTSAVWHGFYPGYYLFFVSMGCFTVVARIVRNHLRSHVMSRWSHAMPVYHVVTKLATSCTLNYTALCFVLLDLKRGIIVWWRFGLFVHVSSLVLFLLIPRLFPMTKPESNCTSSRKPMCRAADADCNANSDDVGHTVTKRNSS